MKDTNININSGVENEEDSFIDNDIDDERVVTFTLAMIVTMPVLMKMIATDND